jgi:pilus assembly protein CpaE
MDNISEPTRVAIVSQDAAVLEAVNQAMKGQFDFSLLNTALLSDDVYGLVQTMRPAIILLDKKFNDVNAITLVENLTSRFPNSAIIMILPESEITQSNSYILAGARAFITEPVQADSLINTLDRVRDVLLRQEQAQKEAVTQAEITNNMLVVYSPKGGAGVSTVAINLAIALRQLMKCEVLLVDGKHVLGHSALMLNLRTGNSITDLIPHAGILDMGLIRQVTVTHISGIQVLPSPVNITKGQGIRPDDLYKVLLGLQSTYPVVVVDGGNYLNDNLITYMDTARRIVLVANPNLASLRDVRQFMDLSHSLSYHKDKLVLVLNQAGRRADVKQGEIERALRAPVFGAIPADENAVLASMNEGVPVIMKHPHHPISRAIKRIARNMLEKGVVLPAGQPDAAPKRQAADVLKKSSRLG